MLMYTAHRTVFRCLSLMTLMAFFPTSVQAWQFVPLAVVREVAADADSMPAQRGLRLLSDGQLAELGRQGGNSPLKLLDHEKLEELSARVQMAAATTTAAAAVYRANALPASRESDFWDAYEGEFILLPAVDAADLERRAIEQREERGAERLKLAQPRVIRKGDADGSGSSSGARVIKKSAPSEAGSATVDASTLLSDADAVLAQGDMGGAALIYFRIQDEFPSSREADFAAETMVDLARKAEKGEIPWESVRTIVASMPSIAASRTPEGKFWVALAHRVAGISARLAGEEAAAVEALRASYDGFRAIADEFQFHPMLVTLYSSLMKTAEQLGPDKVEETMEYLRAVRYGDEITVAKIAAHGELARHYHRGENNIGEAMLEMASLIDNYRADGFEDILGDATISEGYRAQLKFALGYAYFQKKQFTLAVDTFEQILTQFPESGEVRDLAAYYVAYSRYIYHRDLAQGVEFFEDFLTNYPDGPHSDSGYWLLAQIYFEAFDFANSKRMYEAIVNLFPDSELFESAQSGVVLTTERLREEAEAGSGGRFARAAKLSSQRQVCGPWALQRMLASADVLTSVYDIARRARTDETGTTMQALVEVSKDLGTETVGVQAEHVEDLPWPFIALVNDDHFVLVVGTDGQRVTIEDQRDGQRELGLEEFEAAWSGHAIAFESLRLAAAPVDSEMMSKLRGGTGSETLSADVTDSLVACTNQNDPCDPDCDTCCPEGSGAGNAGIARGPDRNPGPFPIPSPFPLPPSSPTCTVPGDTIPDPQKPLPPHFIGAPSSINSSLIPLASNTLGVNGSIDAFQGAISLNETDLAFSSRGPLELTYTRNFHGAWGRIRGYFANDYPWSNNIGKGWNHTYNMHVRSSDLGNEIVYFDSSGNAISWTKTSTSGGYNHFALTSDESLAGPKSNTMKRSTTTGKIEMTTLSGAVFTFAESVDDDFRYSRLESIADITGNTVELSYDDAVSVPFGRLTKVAPDGSDTRFLEFQYGANKRVTKARMMDDTTELKKIEYAYLNKELTKVISNGNTTNTVDYTYDEYAGAYTKRHMASITDRDGNETTFDYEYGSETFHPVTKLTVSYENGIAVRLSKHNYPANLNASRIETLDGSTALAKWEIDSDPAHHTVRPGYMYFYHTPAGMTKDVWDYAYNNEGQLLTLIAPDSTHWVEYTYTYLNRVSTAKWPTGETTSNNYGSPFTDLKPATMTNADGTKTYYYYDSLGRMTRTAHPATSATDPPGASDGILYEYDAYSQVAAVTDTLGNTTTYKYDERGQVTKIIAPDDSVGSPTHAQVITYDDYGNRTSVTDPEGNVTTFEYMHEGCGGCGGGGGGSQLTKVTAPSSTVSTMAYDQNGHMTKSVNPLSQETAYYFDEMYRLTRAVAPGGLETSVEYNSLGLMTRTVGPGGDASTMEYDYLGRATKMTDAEGIDNEYFFDSLGNMTKVRDGLDHDTTYAYDGSNRLLTMVDAVGKKNIYFYDTKGRATKTASGTSGTFDPVEHFYDDTTGQMTKVKYTNSQTANNEVLYYYDRAGRMTQVDDWMGGGGNDGHFYEYDTLGRMTRYRDFDDDPSGTRRTLDYVYDDNGRVLTMTDYEGYNTTYTYTARNHLSTIIAPGSKVWDFDYNALDQRTAYEHPNGMKTLYSYDSQNRMTMIDHNDGTGSPTTLQGWEYALADDGNILRMANLTDDGGWSYGYDGRDRLTDAFRDDANGFPQMRMAYTYDDGDNMLTKQKVVYEEVISDDFGDGDYTSSPTWSVSSGTWTAAAGYMSKTAGSGASTFSIVSTEEDNELWFSYRLDDTSDEMRAYGRYRYGGNGAVYLAIEDDKLEIREYLAAGPSTVVRDSNTDTTSTVGVWYDARILTQGSRVEVWRGLQGEPMTKVLETNACYVDQTNALVFQVYNDARFSIDDVRFVIPDTTADSFADDFESGSIGGDWTTQGTWSAATNAAVNTLDGGSSSYLYQSVSHTDVNISLEYEIDGSSTYGAPYAELFLRRNDAATDYISLVFQTTRILLRARENGGSLVDIAAYNDADSSLDQPYNVQIVMEGSHMEVWWGEEGGELEQVFSRDDVPIMAGDRAYFLAAANNVIRYDDIVFSVPDSEFLAMEYNDANELTRTTQDGVTVTNYTYDEWGRTVTKAQGSYEAVYKYRYGSMLKNVTTDFPGETDVSYIYDGLRNRRFRSVEPDSSAVVSWWRFRPLGGMVAEYADDSTNFWDVGDREVSYVGLGNARILGTNPSNGSEEYLLRDMSGNLRGVIDGLSNAIGRYEFTSSGEQLNMRGREITFGFGSRRWEPSISMYWSSSRYLDPLTSRFLGGGGAWLGLANTATTHPGSCICGDDLDALCLSDPWFCKDNCRGAYHRCNTYAIAAYWASLEFIAVGEKFKKLWCIATKTGEALKQCLKAAEDWAGELEEGAASNLVSSLADCLSTYLNCIKCCDEHCAPGHNR